MHCSSFRPSFDEYVEGTLPSRQRIRIAAHLAACAECTSLLDELRVIDALLLTPRKLDPAPNFTFVVMADVRSMPKPHVSHIPPLRVLAAYLAFAWIAIGLFFTFGDGAAHAAWGYLFASFAHSGDVFTALARATGHLLGPNTFRVTAAMSALLVMDLVLALGVGAAVYLRRAARSSGTA
jgi:anti-sigma factor RsiW